MATVGWTGGSHACQVFGFKRARDAADVDCGWQLVDGDQRHHGVGLRSQNPELGAESVVIRHDANFTLAEGSASALACCCGRSWEDRVTGAGLYPDLRVDLYRSESE